MEVFGLSSMRVTETPAGSIRVEQQFTVPLELAHRASRAYYIIPEINWGNAAHRSLWAIKDSWAGVCEFLEHLSRCSPVELMQYSQNLANQSELERVKGELGLSARDTAIPYGKTDPYQGRWQEILWRLLEQGDGIRGQISRLNGVSSLARAKQWIGQNTVSISGDRVVPLGDPHHLDLLSPNLKRRVLARNIKPFTALWIEEDGSLEVASYKSRKHMLAHIEQEIGEGEQAEVDFIAPQLRQGWQGQPLEARMVKNQTQVRLVTRGLIKLSSAPGTGGYLRQASYQREQGCMDSEQLTARRTRTLPSGLSGPHIKPVNTRPTPRGKLTCIQPENPYA